MGRYIVLLLFLIACGSPVPADTGQGPQASPEPTQPPGLGDQGSTNGGLPCEPPRAYVLTLSDGGVVQVTFPGNCPVSDGQDSPAIDGPDFTHPKNPWIGQIPVFPPVPRPGDPK